MLRKLYLPLLALLFAASMGMAQKEPQPGELPSDQPAQYGGAQTSPSDQGMQSGRSGNQQMIQGTIAKVDSIGNNLTIQTDNNQEETLAVDANTSILVNGRKATVADLKTGQMANVAMEGQKAVRVEASDQTGSNSSVR